MLNWTAVGLLADTQYYVQGFPILLLAQTAFIRAHAADLVIPYVVHLGDITDRNTPAEWQRARGAFKMLDGVVPYALAPGNHDYAPGDSTAATRDIGLDAAFADAGIESWPSLGGREDPARIENSYYLFEAGGAKWLILALEWAPSQATVDWANGVLDAHRDHRAILVTHAYMYNDDTRLDRASGRKQNYNPHSYPTPGEIHDGGELWQELVRRHDVPIVLSGHISGQGYLAEKNDLGGTSHQMLADYQSMKMGGMGYLRLLEFEPDGKTVKVITYSPYTNTLLDNPRDQFSFTLD